MDADKSSWNKITPYLVLLIIELVFDLTECASQAEIDRHLELGKDFLSRGQLSDALTHYHAAVEGDPGNYLTYYKRGTVYFALGKAKMALSDFSRVLDLKPDFTAAKLQRANVNLKLALLTDAAEDYYDIIVVDTYNHEANIQYQRIQELTEDIQLAEAYYRGHDFTSAIELITRILEVCPWSAHMRQLRAECYIATGDVIAAVSDIRSVNRLQQDSTSGYFRLATLLYQLGHVTDSLKEIRECLKLDPEHKDCFPFYKKIKKVEKFLTDAANYQESREYAECTASAQKVLKLEEEVSLVEWEAKRLICSCSVKNEDFTEAIKYCKEALDIQKEPQIYCDRAEALIGLEMYDDAIHSYQDALALDESLQRAKDGLQRAQKLQKQAEKRDYYKILNVKRSATKQEIVKAYRKAAQKWHPDNFQEGDEKKVAEKKFIDVAAAKEVLTNPEKRAQFDAGDDPLDPESGRGGGGNPFQQFHQFHHGSPFQFKFHFN